MKIAFDGRWLGSGGPPSLRRLSRAVYAALTQIPAHTVVAFTPNAHDVPDDLRAGGEIIPVARWPHPIVNGLALPILARRYLCDVMLLQNFGPLAPNTLPCVLLVHDAMFLTRPELFDSKERLYFSLMRPCARRATTIATGSHTELLRMENTGFIREHQRRMVVYNGVFPSPDTPCETLVSDRPFLALGRQNRRKRIDCVLEALAHPLSPADARLDIVGPPDNASADLHVKVHQLGLQDRVRFIGMVSDEEVGQHLAGCRALVYLSQDEGFGLPQVEAMAAGIPAILSDIPVHREVSAQAAIYVDATDPTAVARALVEVSDPVRRQQMVTQARLRGADFTWEKTARQLLDALTGCLVP